MPVLYYSPNKVVLKKLGTVQPRSAQSLHFPLSAIDFVSVSNSLTLPEFVCPSRLHSDTIGMLVCNALLIPLPLDCLGEGLVTSRKGLFANNFDLLANALDLFEPPPPTPNL